MKKETKKVKIGKLVLGGKWEERQIAVQSMLNVPAEDVAGNVQQAKALEEAGCEIVRVAVPSIQDVKLIDAIKKEIEIPLVADIHFDYKIALECAAAGVDKIRINPGNIGSDDRVKAVADACCSRNIPIRIGVNSGSIEREILAKYGHPTPQALCESALYHVSLLNRYDFDDLVISIKSSNVPMMVEAYELMSGQCSYPLHLGVTEAGTMRMGMLKSAAGIGSLLLHGIGDTIRVSLTANPVEEVYAAKDLLKAVGLAKGEVDVVSCPTCGRTKIQLIPLAEQVERAVRNVHKPLKIAVMGCAVNGPGEAREADIGIAGGNGEALLFKKGEVIRKVKEEQIIAVLLEEIDKM